MDIEQLKDSALQFREVFEGKKEKIQDFAYWYPYDTLANIWHFEALLKQPFDTIESLTKKGGSIIDVGCADGQLGFLFETLGYNVDFLDLAKTNFNELAGLRHLHHAFESQGEILEIDLDSQFEIQKEYSLAFCLGLLYHIKNPYYLLENLAKKVQYCFLSTRIFQVADETGYTLEDTAIAYLVDPKEMNNDPTNYWIFTKKGLQRILYRTGWDVLGLHSVGETVNSDPRSADKDERAFCLLKSRHVLDASFKQ